MDGARQRPGRAWPDWQLPVYDESTRELLIQQICLGAASCKEIKDRPVLPTVKGADPRPSKALVEKHMPERVTLSNGRSVKCNTPTPPSRLSPPAFRNCLGWKIANAGAGRVPLVIQILAPSQRPVQITKDLAGFWRDHYPRVKQELRRKYPKHKWE